MADPKNEKPKSYDELKAEIERLTTALAESRQETETQKRAALAQSEHDAVPTGKTVMVTRCKGYETAGYHDDGRAILRPKWHEVEEPTFWFTIDMPPVGGTDIKLNGKEYFHGQTYEVTTDELRTLQDICARLWVHERTIHEDNESVFRQHYDKKLRKFFPRGDVVTAGGKKVTH